MVRSCFAWAASVASHTDFAVGVARGAAKSMDGAGVYIDECMVYQAEVSAGWPGIMHARL